MLAKLANPAAPAGPDTELQKSYWEGSRRYHINHANKALHSVDLLAHILTQHRGLEVGYDIVGFHHSGFRVPGSGFRVPTPLRQSRNPEPETRNPEPLNGRFASFFCPNPYRFVDRQDKHFAVPNLSSSGSFHDGFYGLLHAIVCNNHLKFHFRKKIDCVLASTIDFSVAFLSAETLHFAHGHPFDAYFGQRLLNVFHLKGL